MKRPSLLVLVAMALVACGGEADPAADAPQAPVASVSASEEPSSEPTETTTQAVRADQVAGIAFTIPRPDDWDFAPRLTEQDPLSAGLRDAFATSIEVRRLSETIDEWLERQKAFFDEEGYEVPEDWWREVEVPGADRAVDVAWASGSGDGAINTRLMQIGEATVVVEVYRYIEDLEFLSTQEVEAFLASIRVDPDAFTAASS